MDSETSQNRFFRPPPTSRLADDETRSYVRAEFFSIRARFLDRLACAQVFEPELFGALLLWLDTLQNCYAAADLHMPAADFSQFDTIETYLKQEATCSRNQRPECADAYEHWLGIVQRFRLSDG